MLVLLISNQSTAAALFERAVTGVLDDGAGGLIADGHLLKAIRPNPGSTGAGVSVAWLTPNLDKRAHKTKDRRFDGLKLSRRGTARTIGVPRCVTIA